MELLRPMARLRVSSLIASGLSRPGGRCQCEFTSMNKSQAYISNPPRRFLSYSRPDHQDEKVAADSPQAPASDEPSSTPNPQPSTTTSSNSEQRSNTTTRSRWSALSEATGERPEGSVRTAAADLFGNRRQNPGRSYLEGVSLNAKAADEAKQRADENRIRLRLRPTLGRYRVVDPAAGLDLQSAIGQVEALCKRNSVRIDERNQKIYVRRGQRRKDLRRQRWRKMFKEGFVEEVSRIQRMRRQGW